MVFAHTQGVKLPGGGNSALRTVAKHVYEGVDVVSDYAAQVAYYLIFALFPLLFFVTALAAYLPLETAAYAAIDRIRPFLPDQAENLLLDKLKELLTTTRPQLLTLGFVVAIWSASRGVAAISTALNRAYDVPERRPYWKVQLIAVGVTVVGALLMLLAIGALIVGGVAGDWLARKLGVAHVYHLVVSWLRWPLTAAVVMLASALAYYLLPDVKQKFRYITPGSVIGTALWMLATWGFGLYVSHFGSYDATYGSIGGVIILLTWFYISAAIFLLGGKLNAVLEHLSVHGKEPGQHAEHQGVDRDESRPT
jgi:membrane protein